MDQPQPVKAAFRNGVFVPQEQCDLPDEAEVALLVRSPTVLPPVVTDPEERARILERVVQRMQQHPFPPDAPWFSREELHERR